MTGCIPAVLFGDDFMADLEQAQNNSTALPKARRSNNKLAVMSENTDIYAKAQDMGRVLVVREASGQFMYEDEGVSAGQ